MLGNRDNLLLPQPQVTHERFGVNVLFQSRQELAGTFLLCAPINRAKTFQLARHENIFCHRKVRKQVQFLVNNANACPCRLQR